MLERKDLEHIGWLARLELSEEDKEEYTPKLNAVIDYFSDIDKVDTSGVEPSYHVLPMNNVFREDIPAASLSQDDVISNAPSSQEGFIKAPRMM